ncbi:hypothetical protein IO44_09845 [Gallibacterium anatis str. Avicor]|uniref:hypothetical protein n=1 Tax=Gallibacterium anatis TaxID=750 RepID=UPI0005311373|nr:hypothetical protein [Gallibacterium anatis]KGQ54425.1 hypothetical protein IO44_09845 [Gallibacterium anatis str. Avicor]
MKKAFYTMIAILSFGFIGATIHIFRYYSFDDIEFVKYVYYKTFILSLKSSIVAVIFSWLWNIYELNKDK